MSAALYFISSAIGLLLLFLFGLWIRKTRTRSAATLSGRLDRETEDGERLDVLDELPRLLNRPVVWTIAFIALIGAVFGTVITFFAEDPAIAGLAGVFAAAVFGTIIVGYLLYGTYSMARSRGHSSALSAMEVLSLLGVLAIVATAYMLTTF